MASALDGKRIALAEGRQLEELASLFERDGAIALRFPLLSILDAPDLGPVRAWLRDLAANRFDLVVLMTGEGVRRLLDVADRDGIRNEFVSAIGRVRTVVRGPKPAKALRELGITASLVVSPPTTDGVIAALTDEPLSGRQVGVQMYSPTNPPLTNFLSAARAEAHCVLPYVYAPSADADRVGELIDCVVAGDVDALVFTSSPQVDRLFEVARARGRERELIARLHSSCVAAVGPLVARSLQEHGTPVHVCPGQGFVMKNLVEHVRRFFAASK